MGSHSQEHSLIFGTYHPARNVTVLQCYVSTAHKSDEELEQFYKEVEQVLIETPKQNLILITGNFNASVGENALENDVMGNSDMKQ